MCLSLIHISVAVRTAGENAALNGVQDKLTVLVGDLSDQASGKYDIITANIVANAILSLAPDVYKRQAWRLPPQCGCSARSSAPLFWARPRSTG